ncbi:078422c7-2b3e-4ba3-9768-a273e809c04c-CDS [Sclerotinia trifoliorum]|uniref:Large ribosomal subunit protein uL30m n=1 Tax=Sclerotinia trifoliorum TaxID=28548 RepID=A0A8H2ZMI4_9HELO|nr:078422c7-2b3e-4ba3-9768-a273e809c04c-CDS [Sclerotinia trifoliorum]
MSTTTAAPLTRTLISSNKLSPTLRQIGKNAPKSISKTSPSSSKPAFVQKPWQTSPPPTPTSYFRITLARSAIGLPKKSSRVLKFLGLHKRTASVYHPVSSDIAGQIMKVKELVTVEETKERMSKRQERERRRPEAGFFVERALQEEVMV